MNAWMKDTLKLASNVHFCKGADFKLKPYSSDGCQMCAINQAIASINFASKGIREKTIRKI